VTEQWWGGQYSWDYDSLGLPDGQLIGIRVPRFMVVALWPAEAEPVEDAPAGSVGNYTTPPWAAQRPTPAAPPSQASDSHVPFWVLQLHRGHDQMVEVRPIKGDPFVVNQGHVLSLVKTSEGLRGTHRSAVPGGTIVDISVDDFRRRSAFFRHGHKLYRTGVDLPPTREPPSIPTFSASCWAMAGWPGSSTSRPPTPNSSR
jgi:hypothetical protein